MLGDLRLGELSMVPGASFKGSSTSLAHSETLKRCDCTMAKTRKMNRYSYRASKAAVNQIAKSMDIYLRQRCGDNAMCLSLHPGTVKTGLSEEFWGSTPSEKLFTPDFAAQKLVEVVNQVGLDGRGKCWDWQGKGIPP